MVSMWSGCSGLPKAAPVYQPIQKHQEMTNTAVSEGTHQDKAAVAVDTAKKIAASIPDAAPVVPPLNTASDELAQAKTDNTALKSQITADQTAASAQANLLTQANAKIASLTSDNKTLTTKNTALVKQWNDSWFGGRFWFWIHWVEGILSVTAIALFVAEFFFGLNIHPLTWLFEFIPWIAKIADNFLTATISEIESLYAYIKSRFTPPATPPPK